MNAEIKSICKEQLHKYLDDEQKKLFSEKEKLFDSFFELVFKNGITIFFELFSSQSIFADIREFISSEWSNIISNSDFLWWIISIYIKIFKEVDDKVSKDWYRLVELMGDMHGEPSKFLVNKDNKKFIYYSAENNSEKEIIELLIAFDPKLKNYFPNYIEINNSLYREYIEINNQSNIKWDVENYYYALWYIIPYILTLRWVDLHWENILCNIPYPVFFDFETTFSPFLSKEQEEWYDILKTWLINIGSDGSSHSGIFWALFRSYTSLYPIVEWDFSHPIISRKQFWNKRKSNAVFLEWAVCYPDFYSEFLLQWYKDSSEKIKNNLKQFEGSFFTNNFNSRAIIRVSWFYESMIRFISYLSLQKSKEEIYVEVFSYFEKCPYFISFSPSKDFLKLEFELLYSWLIPIYYSSINELSCINKDGKVIWNIPYLSSELIKTEIHNPQFFDKNYSILKDKLLSFRKEINITQLAEYAL